MRTIGELLIAVKAAKTDEDKTELLVRNKGLPRLEELMAMLTDSEREFWRLPEGVTYRTRDHVLGRTLTLMAAVKTIRYMEKPTRVRPDRLQDMFLGMMDVLHVSEAELAACILERRELPYVSNQLIREAFGFEGQTVAKKAPVQKAVESPSSETTVEDVTEATEEDVAKQFNVVVSEESENEIVDNDVVPTIKLKPKPKTKTVKKPVKKTQPRKTKKK